MSPKEALTKFLKWMDGFEESTLYDDYKRYEGFSDSEYEEVRTVLYQLVQSLPDSLGVGLGRSRSGQTG